MAATRLIPLHINKGKTAAASIKDRIDYAEDPNKTENGNLVASYECDHAASASCDDSPAGGWWINEASLASLCMCYIVF